MNAHQRKFEFGQTYPTRRKSLPFFAIKFIRHTFNKGVASLIHRDALLLLHVIAMKEDQVRYRAVGFWENELTGLLSMTPKRLREVRDLCVQRGWMSYFAGGRGVQAQYFVLVPGGDELVMTDHDLGTDCDSTLQRGMESLTVTPASPIAAASPKPSDVALSPALAPLVSLLKTCGVTGASSCLARSLQLIDAQHAHAVIAYHLSRRIETPDGALWPLNGGAVVERLTNPDYAALPAAEGWATTLNPDWVTADKKTRERRRRADAADRQRAEQDARDAQQTAQRTAAAQLELEFGDLIDALIARSPDRLWQLVAKHNSALAEWGRGQSDGLNSKVIRPKLLAAAQAGLLVE